MLIGTTASVNVRGSGAFHAITRAPSSEGIAALARRLSSRINRATRCLLHVSPASRRSRETRGAPYTPWLALNDARTSRSALVLASPIGDRLVEPCVVPAGRHAQQAAHHLDAMLVLVRFDERVLPPNDVDSRALCHSSPPVISLPSPKVSTKSRELQGAYSTTAGSPPERPDAMLICEVCNSTSWRTNRH